MAECPNFRQPPSVIRSGPNTADVTFDEAEMTLTMQEQVFASMIKVGLPDVVVRQKMMIQGLDVQAQQAFFESTYHYY